jgi:hypothetical protein
MSTAFAPPELSPGNDSDVYAHFTKRHATTPRLRVGATGLTVSAYLSLTLGGAAIGGTTISCPEIGTDGEYLGVLTGSLLTTALAALADGASIYLAILVGTSVHQWRVCVVRKHPTS